MFILYIWNITYLDCGSFDIAEYSSWTEIASLGNQSEASLSRFPGENNMY
jgi:hypothetical protein